MPVKHPVWLIILCLIAVDAAWLTIIGLPVSIPSLLVVVSAVGGLLLLSGLYTHLRPDERLAALAGSFAALFAFTASLVVFSYLVITLRMPLTDSWLDMADKAAGFDWPAVYAWSVKYKAVHFALFTAYSGAVLEIVAVTIFMITRKRYDRVQSLLWIYILCGLTCVILSAFLPAAGGFSYYNTAGDTPYVRQFFAMRNGALKTLDLLRLEGIVQFPSFHLALAVMCTYAVRGVRCLFPALVVFNSLVIVSTIAIGGHFFADLWVSAILTGGIIFFVEHFLRKSALSAYHIGKTTKPDIIIPYRE